MLIQIHIKPILSFEQLFDTRESYVETPFFLFGLIGRRILKIYMSQMIDFMYFCGV
jgi:hypothetical protein